MQKYITLVCPKQIRFNYPAKDMYESIRMTNTESLDSYTSRFKDAMHQYNNYLGDMEESEV